LAATRWVSEVAAVPGLASLDDDAAYRAMDLLLEVEAELARQVFWATATLLDLEVDLGLQADRFIVCHNPGAGRPGRHRTRADAGPAH
jgi:hypothetical protein